MSNCIVTNTTGKFPSVALKISGFAQLGNVRTTHKIFFYFVATKKYPSISLKLKTSSKTSDRPVSDVQNLTPVVMFGSKLGKPLIIVRGSEFSCGSCHRLIAGFYSSILGPLLSTCQSVLGKDFRPQIAPDGQTGTSGWFLSASFFSATFAAVLRYFVADLLIISASCWFRVSFSSFNWDVFTVSDSHFSHVRGQTLINDVRSRVCTVWLCVCQRV